MPLPWLARGLSLVIAEKSAVKLSTPTVGVPDELVVVLALSLSDPPPPQAATTKRAMPARPMVASHLHAERILPPSLLALAQLRKGYSASRAGKLDSFARTAYKRLLGGSRGRAGATLWPSTQGAANPCPQGECEDELGLGVGRRPYAEGAEIKSLEGLVELAADAGGEEVLADHVGENDPSPVGFGIFRAGSAGPKMEAAGIEPASVSRPGGASTSLGRHWDSPAGRLAADQPPG